ncbi:MAG: MgtC/SapB family protein [Myxococcota bacterium]|nr:MgtC/SapB family protein [Myxococcota bacterium]
MNDFDPFTESFWISIGAAILCGGIVGLERQVRGKPAGVRTSILICLGTAVFIRLGASLAGEMADPTRVLGQLVTGVGFLGAGVMFSREGTVVGVTTAAVVWVLAATGAAIGFGLYAGAVALALVTVVILVGVELLESSVRSLARGVHGREQSDG